MDRSEPRLNPPESSDRWSWLVPGLLAVSAVQRLLLVRQGGQMIWSDETRFDAAREAVAQFAAHDYGAAARALLGGADHLFFKVVALLPAALEQWWGTPRDLLPACFLSTLSVLNILLVWRLARTAGAGPREAALAAACMAAAATNFYHARHLFPYDLGMTFGLLAFLAGWTGAGWRRSLACGLCASLAFLTYNGAWLFGAAALLAHVAAGRPGWRRMAGRAVVAGLGLALPIVTAIALARMVGMDLVASFLQFSRTINQGDFGRGWQTLAGYFWAAEGLNLALALAALALVAAGALVARRWTRGASWLAAALFIVLGLVALSDWWEKSVIHGRTARFAVPLVCLAAAHGVERLWVAGGWVRAFALGGLLLMAGQAVANFRPPLEQVFPRQFYREAVQLRKRLRAAGEQRQLAIIHADTLVGRGSIPSTLPDHEVMLAAANPVQYRPYLFEGHTAADRRLLGRSDVRMRLIAVDQARFDHPAELRHPHPGVVRLTLRLPEPRLPPGVPQPLLVTGETGRGDFLYLVSQADDSIRIGFDHWNAGGKVSDPVLVDPARPVEITLSLGPLHGPLWPEQRAAFGVDPHDWLYVEVNGRVIWSHPAEFHPATPGSITFLNNHIGGSTAGIKFTGAVIKIQSLLVPPFADHPREMH